MDILQLQSTARMQEKRLLKVEQRNAQLSAQNDELQAHARAAQTRVDALESEVARLRSAVGDLLVRASGEDAARRRSFADSAADPFGLETGLVAPTGDVNVVVSRAPPVDAGAVALHGPREEMGS